MKLETPELGVPVVMVEAGSILFRLTALPPWTRVWREAELGALDLDPASHRTPAWLERREQWRSMVRERLLERMGAGQVGGDVRSEAQAAGH